MEVDADVKVALAEIVEVRAFFLLDVIDVESDLAPLVDDVNAGDLVGLFDVAVLERERETLRHARFFEQSSRLLARRFDVLAEAGELGEFRLGRCELLAGPKQTADIFHHGNLRQRFGRAPAIDGEAQRAPHAHIVERFLFVVERTVILQAHGTS